MLIFIISLIIAIIVTFMIYQAKINTIHSKKKLTTEDRIRISVLKTCQRKNICIYIIILLAISCYYFPFLIAGF